MAPVPVSISARAPNSHPNAHPSAGIYSNADAIAAQLRWYQVRTALRVGAIVRHHAMLAETAIKARASGRPGPRAITGDYRRSWTHTVVQTPALTTATIGTNKPQGRRLEYGFVGADRLGRKYNQPPFPHVQPAVEAIRPVFLAALGAAVRP